MSDSSFAPAFIIKVNGQRLPVEREADVKEIVVYDRTDAPSKFFVRVSDFDYEWTDNDDFFIGSEFEIHLGYKDEVTQVMTGEVTGLKLNFQMQQDRILTICGMCKLNRLNSNRMTRAYSEMTVADIVSELAGEAGLSVDCENLTDEHTFTMIKDQSGLEALQDIAVRYDCIFRMVDGNLEFKRLPPNSTEDVTLEYGKTLLEFYPKRSIFDTISEVQVFGYNLSTNEQVTGGATKDDVDTKGGEIVDEAFGGFIEQMNDFMILDDSQADQMAIDILARNSRKFFSGWGKARGDVNIRAGSIVKLVGLGERFSQTYYVYAARHVLTLWGYVTYFFIDANVGNPGAQSQSDAQSSSSGDSSESSGDEAATAEESGASESSEDSSRSPAITNLKWTDLDEAQIDSALVNQKVLMYADVTDIDDGTVVAIQVFEKEQLPDDKCIMRLSARVKEQKIICECPIINHRGFFDHIRIGNQNEWYVKPILIFKIEDKKDKITSGDSPELKVFSQLECYLINEETGAPYADLNIKILCDGEELGESTTDEEGHFLIEELYEGEYTFEVMTDE